MSSWKSLVWTLSLTLFGLVGPTFGEDPKPLDIVLLDQTFIVDDQAKVLSAAGNKDKTLAAEDVAEQLAVVLTDNNNIFARLESIRRAAVHILRLEVDTVRKAEAMQLLGVLKTGYVKHGGKFGNAETVPAPRDPNSAKQITADKVNADTRDRAFARVDLAYGISLLRATKLIETADLADLKLCSSYLKEAKDVQLMPELSFCFSVLCCAKDANADMKEWVDKAIQRTLECDGHIRDAVLGSVSGDLLDRNLVHVFGIKTVEKHRSDAIKDAGGAAKDDR